MPYNYGKTWTPEEHAEAIRLYKSGVPLNVIAERLGRSIAAVKLRIYYAVGKWSRRLIPPQEID